MHSLGDTARRRASYLFKIVRSDALDMPKHSKALALASLTLAGLCATASYAQAAATPATGSYTTQSGLVNVLAFPASSERASAFQIGLGQTTNTEIAYSDNTLRTDDLATPYDESLNEMWSFCVQPYELDSLGSPTLIPAEFYVNGDHSLASAKIMTAHNSKQVRYIMNKVPLYAKNGSLGAGAPIGLLSDRASTSYIGTPVASTAVLTVGSSSITVSARDLEYASVSLAVRKILDPSLNLDNIDASLKSVLKTRAEEYVTASASNSAAFVEPDTKNSYGVTLATEVKQGSVTVTVTGLDGTSGAETPLVGKTVRLWNQSLDLDSAPGSQNQVTATTDANGKAVFTLGNIPSSTPAKVVVEKAIAPGTLVKSSGQVTAPSGSTTTTPAKAQQQMLATAGWGRVASDVTLAQSADTPTSLQTTVPSSTTAPGNTLPSTGPDNSRLFIFLTVMFGVAGLYLAQRREPDTNNQ